MFLEVWDTIGLYRILFSIPFVQYMTKSLNQNKNSLVKEFKLLKRFTNFHIPFSSILLKFKRWLFLTIIKILENYILFLVLIVSVFSFYISVCLPYQFYPNYLYSSSWAPQPESSLDFFKAKNSWRNSIWWLHATSKLVGCSFTSVCGQMEARQPALCRRAFNGLVRQAIIVIIIRLLSLED